jgi:hypothetical protein
MRQQGRRYLFFIFNVGFLSGELVLLRQLDLLRLQHNLTYHPADRAAGILGMRGYMLGKGLRLHRLQIVTPINAFNSAAGKCIRSAQIIRTCSFPGS